MNIPFKSTVTFTVTCGIDHCQTKWEQTFKMAPNTPIPLPVLPLGWQTVNGYPICNHHQISFEAPTEKKESTKKPVGIRTFFPEV